MPFEELTKIVGDVVEQKSYGCGVSSSSHPHGEWRDKLQIGELITIGEVSNPGGHGDQASLMWVMEVVGDISFTVARMSWSDKVSEDFSPHQLPFDSMWRGETLDIVES